MQKTYEIFFKVPILKVTDENSRIRIRSWSRIRWSEVQIRTNVSRIRNTG
jgi:hypothetical protein